MPFRVTGNNTSFTTASTFSTGSVITSFVWNSLVATNLNQMKLVTQRVPAIYEGQIIGDTNAAGLDSWIGTTVRTRHRNLKITWYEMPSFIDSLGNTKYHIYPKDISTGPTVMNTTGNYFVFHTPGIYNIEVSLNWDTTSSNPTMMRMALVPYVNNGSQYQLASPFDLNPWQTTFSNNNNSMLNCLLAYTGRLDGASTFTVNMSGFVLVTSQTLSNAASYSNIAINNPNPLTPGNAYHFEIEGYYANLSEYTSNNPRFVVTGGYVSINLLQEWWK